MGLPDERDTGSVRDEGPDWVERRATGGTGVPARLAARVLCARLNGGNIYREVHPVARLLCQARDESVVRMAQTALERAWARPFNGPSAVWYGLHTVSADNPCPAVVRFLLAPTPGGRYHPPVRVVAVPDEREDLCAGSHLVRWLEQFSEIADMLRVTDHPDLLYALDDAFIDAVRSGDADRLWAGAEPSPLLRVLLDNPHLERPPRIESPTFGLPANELAVLAILKGRHDLLRHYRGPWLVADLARAAARPLPALIVDACRQHLRELGPGEGREHLCELAMDGDPEARAAAVDADYLPAAAERVPLFLFCTEQWARLDTLDPKCAQLRRHRPSYNEHDWRRLRDTATRTGRRAPKPLPLPRYRRAEVNHPEPYRPGGTGTAGTGGYTGGFGI